MAAHTSPKVPSEPHHTLEDGMIPPSILEILFGAGRVSDHGCRAKGLGVTQVGSSLSFVPFSSVTMVNASPSESLSGFQYEWGS